MLALVDTLEVILKPASNIDAFSAKDEIAAAKVQTKSYILCKWCSFMFIS